MSFTRREMLKSVRRVSSACCLSRGVVPAVNSSTSGGARRLCGLETPHEAREQEFLQRQTVMFVDSSVGWACSRNTSGVQIG